MRKQLGRLAWLTACGAVLCGQALGFGVFTLTAGRKDYANRYDVAGQLMYAGQSNANTYAFGKWAAFNALPPNVTNAMVTSALSTATNTWSQWANVSYDNSGLNAAGTGLLRLRYDSTKATGAHAYAFVGGTAGEVGYAEIVYGVRPQAGVNWNATNFAWTMMHEMGHTLGLVDLYENQTEDFADHPINENANPNLTASSTQDNVMHRYNNGNNYGNDPTTGIDNDEIFGVSYLWGSNTSQIFTGELAAAFNGNGRRGSANHHGQQTAGWWTYRGTFGSYLLTEKPYVDIDFLGYTGDFTGSILSDEAAAWEYVGNQGGGVERFRVNKAGIKGNFILKLKSRYLQERRVDAKVVTGGNGVSFTLAPNLNGLTYEQNILGGRSFAKVYGPVPEPSAIAVLGIGCLAFLRRRRRLG
ncbi:MAG: PEP-CTERM sorting domain-containing protein [Armatimonadetes bacterium]|nr:PEP-CTERM sorting domain-containing protein [Armatimonadota bacterium]